jgi:hypothetical protein
MQSTKSTPPPNPQGRQQQYLHQMGIEVWSLRDPVERDPVLRDAIDSEEQAQPTPSSEPAQASAIQPVPEFHLCIYDDDPDNDNDGRICLVFQVPLKGGRQSADIRHLANDVCRYLGFAPRIVDFRWPMIRSSHLDQSGLVVRQVLEEKLASCADKLVLFGDVATQYVDERPRRRRLTVEDISGIVGQAGAKRRLWQTLNEFVRDNL